MAVYKNYVNKFYSQRGNRWDLEIWSRSDSSLDSVEFSTGKGGFKLSYKGGDDRQDIIMPSEVTIPFIVKNADDEAFLNSILSSPDGEYFLVIRRNFVLFWWGNLNAGFDTKTNDYYPYISTIKANDFLGELVNDKSFSPINLDHFSLAALTTNFFAIKSNISVWDDDVFPLGILEKCIYTNMRWTANNQISYSDSWNVFAMFYANSLVFDAGGNNVNNYKKSEAFKETMKAFGLKMFLADGKMYCLQPYNYIQGTTNFQQFTTTNTNIITPTASDEIVNYQNANNDLDIAPTDASGFQLEEWILEPADFTDSIWQANGSVTSITSNSFNIAATSSYLYIDLAEGDYCLSYSENYLGVYITKNEGGGTQSLLDESGHKNFSVGSGGAELIVRSSVAGTISVEHIGLQKGAFTHRSFLAGTSFRYDRPISAATATFNFGSSVAQAQSNFPTYSATVGGTIPSTSQYTTLTAIGAIAASTTATLTMNMNVYFAEKFDFLSAASAVTHIGGTITCKLKIGSQYLTGAVDGTLSFTSTDSTFTIPIPIAEITSSFFAFNAGFMNHYIDDVTGAPFFDNSGTEGIIGANYPVELPNISVGGTVNLQFVSGVINYYTNPDTSNPNVAPTPLTLTKNNLESKFFTGGNVPNYNFDTIYFSISSSIDNESSQGIQFSSSTELGNYQNVDLGTLKLGTSNTDNAHINNISVLNSTFQQEVPSYLQVNNTGTNYYMTQLLLEQYIEIQEKPLEIIQGDYYVNDFSAFKSILLDGDKYVFFEGTLNAEEDVVSGSWYKVEAGTETITTDNDDVIVIEEDTPPTPPPPNPHDPLPDTNIHIITNQITKGKDWIKYNGLGLSNVAISTTDTKVTLMGASKGKLYNGQKLLFARPDLSHPIVLTKSGDSTTSDTQIDVASFTPEVTYPAGSILAIAQYDLTNVITGGGGGTPGGSNTEVQFNDSGAFNGTDLLKVTGANELTIGGTNSNILFNSGADLVLGADTAGGTSSTIQYLDSGSTNRVMLGAYATDIVVLSNRAANGEVQIRANTSTAGGAGELIIATFKDTSVDFLNAAELRGSNIGNIFDLEAYLTAVDFCMTTNGTYAGFTARNGGSSEVSSSSLSQYATFQVPLGYKATHVQVNGSSSSSTFDVYACSVTSQTATALTSSPAVNTNQSLSTQQVGGPGSYISIKFTPGATRRAVYGAKITLERV